MAELNAAAPAPTRIHDEYMALVRQRRIYSGLMILIFVLLMVSGFQVANDRNAGGFLEGIHQVFAFPEQVLGEAWEKIDRLPGNLLTYFPSLLETLNIAGTATLMGVIIGTVLSLLSTRGLARFPRLVPLFRRIMDIMRAIPEVVIALVLIYVLGGGPVPAMIAIAFHTSGAIGKLYSEVNENADLKPVEGLKSTGASWLQQMWLGVIPQVAPNYLSYALLRFEINIRASAILGYVGAGGIGYDLRNTMSWGVGRFDQAAAIFMLLFLSIMVVDQISSRYRDRLIHGRKA